MVERVKDWKTTIPGVIIGVALIVAALYVMRLHNDWTWREVLDFVGGLAVVVGGLLARSSVPAAEPQTEQPKPLGPS